MAQYFGVQDFPFNQCLTLGHLEDIFLLGGRRGEGGWLGVFNLKLSFFGTSQ